MGCTYVKEFDFGTKKAEGGAVKYAKGGAVKGPGFKGPTMIADKSSLGIKGNKNPGIKGNKPVAPNLPTLKLAKGGAVHEDVAMDKKAMAKAVHKHEKALHKGEPLTKLAKGGKVPRVEAMEKREMAETPSMRRESAMSSRKVQAPVRKMVPVASREPMLAMKKGGKASMC
jgi:ribosomal protein S6